MTKMKNLQNKVESEGKQKKKEEERWARKSMLLRDITLGFTARGVV